MVGIMEMRVRAELIYLWKWGNWKVNCVYRKMSNSKYDFVARVK